MDNQLEKHCIMELKQHYRRTQERQQKRLKMAEEGYKNGAGIRRVY